MLYFSQKIKISQNFLLTHDFSSSSRRLKAKTRTQPKSIQSKANKREFTLRYNFIFLPMASKTRLIQT
jgi:hypothetical protein